MKKNLKEQDKIQNPVLSTAPQQERVINIFINKYILDFHRNNLNSKFSITFNNSRNIKRKSNTKSSHLTPKSKRFQNFYLDSYISLLNSKYKNSIKNTIINSKNLDLVQKQVKVLEAKERKMKAIKSYSEKLEKKINKTKIENIKQKSLIENFRKLKEKENTDKKNKVKILKKKNDTLMIKSKEERNKYSERLAKSNKQSKMKRLKDLSNEKNKNKEEKKTKKNLIKKMDLDILKRKEENEKYKKIIMIKNIKKEIKLQEEFNKKLLSKINKFKKIGLIKIEQLIN